MKAASLSAASTADTVQRGDARSRWKPGTFMEHSMPTVKKTPKRKKKEAMSYDPNPPRCYCCIHFQGNVMNLKPGTPWQPGKCTYGGFGTFAWGVCDMWTGRNGEALE